MSEFTILTKEQIDILGNDGLFGTNGEIAKITDFASLLGCYQYEDGIGEWWTKTPYYYVDYDEKLIMMMKMMKYDGYYDAGVLCVINENGMDSWENQWNRYVGARPAFSISSVVSKERKKELED